VWYCYYVFLGIHAVYKNAGADSITLLLILLSSNAHDLEGDHSGMLGGVSLGPLRALVINHNRCP